MYLSNLKKRVLSWTLAVLLTFTMGFSSSMTVFAETDESANEDVEVTEQDNVTEPEGDVSEQGTEAAEQDEITETEGDTTSEELGEGEAIEYATLADEIAAAKAGDTIALKSDVSESISIAADKNITIDLNGYTLQNANAGEIVIDNAGTLTLIDSKASGLIESTDGANYTIQNTGTLTI